MAIPERLALALLPLVSAAACAGEWSGFIASEGTWFPQSALYAGQHSSNLSLSAQAEYNHDWNRGDSSIHFVPYVRIDQRDAKRSHVDLRELNYLQVGDDWELQLGIGKVFWGVTEAVHLVDIINQDDRVENQDGEDKLGQPMINLSLIRDWGTVDLFVLPGFRERTFPGAQGRPRLPVVIDTDRPLYESAAGDLHTDLAIRWSQSIGDWDIGLAHFYGTTREPALIPVTDSLGNLLAFRPFYEIINQTGLDLQATKGDWLWKLEVIHRSGQGPRYIAAAGGFEYTFVGILDTAMDIGLVSEYLYDERGTAASTPFQDDVVIGTRLTLNDVQSTEALISMITDLDGGGQTYNIEASRRLGQNWKLSLEARGTLGTDPGDALHPLRRDHAIKMELARYF